MDRKKKEKRGKKEVEGLEMKRKKQNTERLI